MSNQHEVVSDTVMPHVYAIRDVIPRKQLDPSVDFDSEGNVDLKGRIARMVELCINRWIHSEGGSIGLFSGHVEITFAGVEDPDALEVTVTISDKRVDSE